MLRSSDLLERLQGQSDLCRRLRGRPGDRRHELRVHDRAQPEQAADIPAAAGGDPRNPEGQVQPEAAAVGVAPDRYEHYVHLLNVRTLCRRTLSSIACSELLDALVKLPCKMHFLSVVRLRGSP